MQAELLQLIQQVLPSTDPKLVQALQLDRLKRGGFASDIYANQVPANVCQGDVFGPVPFVYIESGQIVERDLDGMLISRSCDYDKREHVQIAPCIPLERFRETAFFSSLKTNERSDLLYLPNVNLPGGDERAELVVDFMAMQRFPTREIVDSLGDGSMKRTSSFTDLGYVMLLLKLTIHFLSPQGEDETRGTAQPRALKIHERATFAIRMLAEVGRYLLTGQFKRATSG